MAARPVLIEFLSGTYAPRLALRARPRRARETVDGKTVAVLPFADLGLKGQNQYFSDGLTEELIHALTKVPRLRVVAWNTAAQLRGRQDDVRSLREQLQVDAVLTGSVRIAGGSLRVRAQLIDTASGVYLWSETFERHMQDVFSIQEEIALAIVRTLRVQLAGEGEGAFLARGRSTIGSYDYYLKGRYYWHRRSPEDLRRSMEYFEAAIAADHTYAPALAGLADAYTLLVDYGLLHPSDGMPKAKAAAERAIELDSRAGRGVRVAGHDPLHYEWEWQESLGLYQRAIALNPGYATAHHWLGTRLVRAERSIRRGHGPHGDRASARPALQHHSRRHSLPLFPGGPAGGGGTRLPRDDPRRPQLL